MPMQRCPNCLKIVDVGIYVSGQRIRCPACQLPFVVERAEDSASGLETAGDAAGNLAGAGTPVEADRTDPEEPRGWLTTTPARPVSAHQIVDRKSLPKLEREPQLVAEAPHIPGYRPVSILGQGAMGTVYRAIQESTGETVALKVLAEKWQTRSDFVARYEREVAALRAVDHPYVVKLLDHGSVGDRRYFVMEYVEGVSLRQEFSVTRPLPVRVVAILRSVAEGLIAAHDAGVIHRDLKPENVVVRPEGGVSIIDFGLAGLFGGDDPHPNLTHSRVTMGTVNYMAPEQRTDAKHVDQRADLYALGVMLYEGLTGDLPVGRFQFPRERGLPLPTFADAILSRALAKAPKDRYPDGRAFLEDLDKLAKVLKTAADSDVPTRRPSSTVVNQNLQSRRRSIADIRGRRTRQQVTVAAGLVLTAGALALLLGWCDDDPRTEIVITESRAYRSSKRDRVEAPSLGLISEPSAQYRTQFGQWRPRGSALEHRATAETSRLQPVFARAVLDTGVPATRIRLHLGLEADEVPERSLELARMQGLGEVVDAKHPERIGVGFAAGDRVVGGFVGRDGSCGYFRVDGLEQELWPQVCNEAGTWRGEVSLTRDGASLAWQIGELYLPPRELDVPAEAQPALLCQNARCTFSPSRDSGASAKTVRRGGGATP